MKFAKSMRYGGELIDAAECDYDSYLHLGVVCPECQESLFLRAGGHRISAKGNRYQVGAHWCHRSGTPESIANCEMRVNNYTEEERNKIKSKARNQRLKLFQKWMWTAFIKSSEDQGFNILENIRVFKQPPSPVCDFTTYHNGMYYKPIDVICRLIPDAITIDGYVDSIIKSWLEKGVECISPEGFIYCTAAQRSFIAQKKGAIKSGKHSAICKEIAHFLFSKKQSHILEDLVIWATFNIVDMAADTDRPIISSITKSKVDYSNIAERLPDGRIELNLEPFCVYDKDFFWGLSAMVGEAMLTALCLTPWADAFNELELSAKSRLC